MKLSDYVISHLASLGIKHVFLLTGGAATHLVDSFRNVEGIDYICVQHEQAAAMAADAYSRLGGFIGVAITTSGPGATNLLTGTGCSWFDSIPCLYLTGQVNTYEYKDDSKVRQVGFQETDIVSIIKPISKFAHMVTDPKTIRYYLEKAIYVAKSGRPGPVLLDLPMDVQRAEIEPSELEGFEPEIARGDDGLISKIKDCAELIEHSIRPIIIAGGGVRNAGATEELEELAELAGIPVAATFCGIDSFPHDHPLYVGFMGVYGNRYANFAVANCDLLIGVGSRFDTRQTGTQPKSFAREARKIVVDIDPEELNKRVTADIAICCDAKDFLVLLKNELSGRETSDISAWLDKIAEYKAKYPICRPEYYDQPDKVNPYVFMKTLSEEAADDEVIIVDAGQNLMWGIQTLEPRGTQRVFSAGGMSPMGYSLPAAIGAAVCRGKRAVCTIGDGGMQVNIQELQTIFHYQVPVKIFVMNNHSYGIIKQFQDLYFGSRYEATGRGYSCPNFVKVAEAYGIKAIAINNHAELQKKIRQVLDYEGPILCDVELKNDTLIIPKLEVNKPIEDQTPYLDREEFLSNMIIKPFKEG